MRDYRKFCMPKTTKNPQVGDIEVKLNNGNVVYVKLKDYKKHFKINSIIGESSESSGNLKVLFKLLNKEIFIDINTYTDNQNLFDLISVVDSKDSPNKGDIICHNTILNDNYVFSYNNWLNLNDSWDLVGLYDITTYDEENASDGDYVIMSNGHTLIINPSDYDSISNLWEHVDTINKE